MTSGEDRLAEFERVLDEYNTATGLAYIKYNSEVENCMSLTRAQINAMTVSDCSVYNMILTQYSAYLQMQFNRHRVRVDWATRELDLIVAKEASKYGYGDDKNFVKYDLVKNKIILANEAARVLNNIIKHASARTQELEQMSQKIAMVGRALYDVRMIKVKSE
jgi:hypothetical protein